MLFRSDPSKFYEVQKFLSVTRHAYTPFMVLYSKPLWDKLSNDERSALSACSIEGRDEQRKVSRELSEKSLASLKARGMQINEVSQAEYRRMFEKVQAVYDKHQSTIGAETITRLKSTLADIRK